MQRAALADLGIDAQARVGLDDRDGLAHLAVADMQIDVLAARLGEFVHERHGGRGQRALVLGGLTQRRPACAEAPHAPRVVLNRKAARLQGPQQAEASGPGAAGGIGHRGQRRRPDGRKRFEQIEGTGDRGDAVVARRTGRFGGFGGLARRGAAKLGLRNTCGFAG